MQHAPQSALVVEQIRGPETAACFALRAAEYSRFYRNIPPAQFFDEFDSADAADGTPLSYLFGVRRGAQWIGTCRLVVARHPSYPECRSEIGEIVQFSWSQVNELAGASSGELAVGEIGKFAVAPEADGRLVKWLLLTAVGTLAQELGLQVVLALMPPVVERAAARQAGFHFRRIDSAALRREDPANKQLLLRYHDYFLPMFRRNGMEIDVERLPSAHPHSLDMLLAGAADGPALWWIRPDELATAELPISSHTEHTTCH